MALSCRRLAAEIVRMDSTGTVASHASAWTDEALSHLVTRRRVVGTPNRTAWAIRAATAWLGPEVESAPAGMHRYQADLRLRVSERPDLVTFGKAALVDFGNILLSEDGWEVEVGWRASTLAPLFPVFSGRIVAHTDELTLSGWYAPPFGKLGQVADRLLLHIAATGTARWLLGEIDKAATRSVR
jgi:hypothetical protein